MTETPSYFVMDSPVGKLLLVARGRKMTTLEFENGRHARGFRADWVENDRPFAEARRQLDEYFAGTGREFDLPLAPPGTPFQRRVWIEMARIPFGATASYGALARKTGSVARADGGACGANPIPIVIPCHRVVGEGGVLVGFSGGAGVETKRALLELEGFTPREPDLFDSA